MPNYTLNFRTILKDLPKENGEQTLILNKQQDIKYKHFEIKIINTSNNKIIKIKI